MGFQQVYSRRFACSRGVEVCVTVLNSGIDRGGFGHHEEGDVRILRPLDARGGMLDLRMLPACRSPRVSRSRILVRRLTGQ
jgi:hypothetical protein